MRGKWLNKVLYFLFLVVILEITARIACPMPEISNFNRINYQVLFSKNKQRDYLMYENRYWQSTPDTLHKFMHHLNGYGFRDREWQIEKKEGKTRVMIIGDSFVEGVMADQDQSIPAQLRTMDGNEEWEVMNAGMMGIGIDAYTQLILDAVPVFKPDLVCLVLFSNDMPFRGSREATTDFQVSKRNQWKPRLMELVQWKKKGQPIPFRWGGSSSFLPAVPSPANFWTTREKQLKSHVLPSIAKAMKKGEFSYLRTNWILEEEQLLRSTPPDVTRQLTLMRDCIRKNGGDLQLFYLPTRAQVTTHYYQFEKDYCLLRCPPRLDMTYPEYQIHQQVLGRKCQELGMPFTDLTNEIKEKEQKGEHLYWRYDDHMKAKGYRFVAGKIFKKMGDWKTINRNRQ